MHIALRVCAALPGALFMIMGLNWAIDPQAAAAGLGMALLDGAARSAQIGDIGAFFIGLGCMILLGVVTLQKQWFYAAGLLLGGAATMRLLAWIAHGAPFTADAIAVEVVATILMLVAASRCPQKN